MSGDAYVKNNKDDVDEEDGLQVTLALGFDWVSLQKLIN